MGGRPPPPLERRNRTRAQLSTCLTAALAPAEALMKVWTCARRARYRRTQAGCQLMAAVLKSPTRKRLLMQNARCHSLFPRCVSRLRERRAYSRLQATDGAVICVWDYLFYRTAVRGLRGEDGNLIRLVTFHISSVCPSCCFSYFTHPVSLYLSLPLLISHPPPHPLRCDPTPSSRASDLCRGCDGRPHRLVAPP